MDMSRNVNSHLLINSDKDKRFNSDLIRTRAAHHHGSAVGHQSAKAIGERSVVVGPTFGDQRESVLHRHPVDWSAMDTAACQQMAPSASHTRWLVRQVHNQMV